MNRIDFTNSIQGCSPNEIFDQYFNKVMFLYNILDGSYNNIKIMKSSHDSFIIVFDNIIDAENLHNIISQNCSFTIYGNTYNFESIINENELDITFIQI